MADEPVLGRCKGRWHHSARCISQSVDFGPSPACGTHLSDPTAKLCNSVHTYNTIMSCIHSIHGLTGKFFCSCIPHELSFHRRPRDSQICCCRHREKPPREVLCVPQAALAMLPTHPPGAPTQSLRKSCSNRIKTTHSKMSCALYAEHENWKGEH